MLRIKIVLEPYGKKEWQREIGEIEIINDGTGDHSHGNYIYELWDANTTLHDKVTIKGELKGHNRMQSAFRLLQAVLNKALGKEDAKLG